VSRRTPDKEFLENIKQKDAVINGISDALILLDAGTMEILEVNRSFLDNFNVSREEVLGKTCHQIAHHLDLPCYEMNIDCPVAVTRSSGETATAEHIHLDRDGRPLYFEITTCPLKNEKGEVDRIIHLSRNITDRKRAEEAMRESEEKYRTLFNQSVDAIYLHDAEGNILDVNRVSVLYSGYSKEELLSLTVFDLHPDKTRKDEIMRKWGQWPLGQRFTIEASHRRKDNSVYPVEVTTGRVHFGNRELILASVRDITERKQAEEALRRSHDELEIRVQERTAELERKNRELQEFTFVAAHDLSEPLRKIQAFGSFLQERSNDRLSEKERDYISRMTGAANRMRELINAILAYSRLDMEARQFKPVRLDDIVRDAVMDLEAPIREIQARVEIGPLPSLEGEPNQLRQLFQNLISNSLKYRRAEVTTFVRIHGEGNNGNCRILVEDNGIGFDEKYLDKIFKPFQNLHARDEYPGTGIGLAVCRKIVERHGGTITAESTPGKGSTFIVTLPVAGKCPGSRTRRHTRGTPISPET
jgi:two-component system sensor kinase FixL